MKGANFAALIANRLPGVPLQDKTLEDKNTVFQILKRHYARYTPEMVERICGTPKELFLKVAEIIGYLCGGHLSFSAGEDITTMKTRLLTPSARDVGQRCSMPLWQYQHLPQPIHG